MRWGTTLQPTPDGSRHETCVAVHLETDDDLIDLRDNHPDFHEGAMSVVTFPSFKQGFLNHDLPRIFGGLTFLAGAIIYKVGGRNFPPLHDENGLTPA